MESTYESDFSQFQNRLLKLRRDKFLSANNSKDIEKKAEQEETIVLRGSPRLIFIWWSIILLIIAVMLSVWIFGFNFLDLQTFIIIISIWFGTGVLFVIVSMSNLIILHPDGILIRRFIFFKFSRKWKSLTQPPFAAIRIDPNGSKYYNLILEGPWKKKRMNTIHIGIQDIKKKEDKLNFIVRIAQIYYEKSQKS